MNELKLAVVVNYLWSKNVVWQLAEKKRKAQEETATPVFAGDVRRRRSHQFTTTTHTTYPYYCLLVIIVSPTIISNILQLILPVITRLDIIPIRLTRASPLGSCFCPLLCHRLPVSRPARSCLMPSRSNCPELAF